MWVSWVVARRVLLALELDGLFGIPAAATGLRATSSERPRDRRPKRTMMTASRALSDRVVSTWAASVEEIAAEPTVISQPLHRRGAARFRRKALARALL